MLNLLLRLTTSSNLRFWRTTTALATVLTLLGSIAAAAPMVVRELQTGDGRPLLVASGLYVLVIATGFVLVWSFTRWRGIRNRAIRRLRSGSPSAVYLVPPLRRFLDDGTDRALTWFHDSVSLVVAPGSIEFWAGVMKPYVVASIPAAELAEIESGSFDHYLCAELRVRDSDVTVPLLLAGTLLGIRQSGAADLASRLRGVARSSDD